VVCRSRSRHRGDPRGDARRDAAPGAATGTRLPGPASTSGVTASGATRTMPCARARRRHSSACPSCGSATTRPRSCSRY
jgi:hypothetical protein